MSQSYPEDSIQFYCSPWWVRAKDKQMRRGRLLWAFVPHVDQRPYFLVAEDRAKTAKESILGYSIEHLRGSALPSGANVPIPGFPHYPSEVRLVCRAKRRPILVLSTGGLEVPNPLRTGAARYQTNPTFLAAPYYGADQGSGLSGGWRPDFVARIRRCEYPQYMWDSLPLPGRRDSILRLDHLQPIGRHGGSYQVTDYELHEGALKLVDDYLAWLLMEEVPENSLLIDLRKAFLDPN